MNSFCLPLPKKNQAKFGANALVHDIFSLKITKTSELLNAASKD